MTSPTIDAYDKYAHVYDEEVVEFWENFPVDFIDAFTSGLNGRRVLNLGSGSGRDAILLRDRNLEVVCLDASSSMAKITQDLGFDTHHKTFDQMNFSPISFDGVWAYASLIHVEKSEAKNAIIALRETLKPGGLFVVGAIQGDSAGMTERSTMPGAQRYFKKYKSSDLTELVESIGFKKIREQNYQPHTSSYINLIFLKE